MRTVLAACLGLFSALSLAAPGSLQQIEQQMQQDAQLRGDYTQLKYIAGFDRPLRSSGSYVYSRERGVLWRVAQPYAADYLLTPESTQHRQDGRWQPLDPGGAGTANLMHELTRALLAGELSALETHFQAHIDTPLPAWRVRLVPRNPAWAKLFREVALSGTRRIERVNLIETSGDRTELLLELSGSQALSDEEQAWFGLD